MNAPAEPHDLDALAGLAVRVAQEAGALLRDGLRRARTTVETKSTGTDMVTEMDRASEALIERLLREARPDDGLVAEEGTQTPSRSGVRWIADPLDGTTNYLYGFPSYGVSIAAELDGTIVAGAVYDPTHDETFRATAGGGATCNGRPLAVAGPPTIATALIGTGFSYDPERRRQQAALLPGVLPHVRDVRRAGAAALDLCWVGLGRLDAYYEWGLAPWDWAAGSLVAAEAGARVERLPDGTVVAGPPHLFAELVALLR